MSSELVPFIWSMSSRRLNDRQFAIAVNLPLILSGIALPL